MSLIFPSQIESQSYKSYTTESHFLGAASPSQLPANLTATGAGAGASILTTAISGRPGVMSLNTGTATNGAMLWRSPSSLHFGSGTISLEIDFRIPTLSDATDNFAALLGIGGTYVTGTDEMTSAAYLYMDATLFYPTMKQTGGTAFYDVLSQPASSNWHNLKLSVSSGVAAFDLNGVVADQRTYGLVPTDAVAVFFHIFKMPGQTGVSDRALQIDYFKLDVKL
jgi:hypothetical protein